MRSAADVTATKPLNRSAGLVPGVAFASIPIVEMDSTASPISEVIAMKTVESAKGLANARWLVEHDLPVTGKNILYKSELDGLKGGNGLDDEFIYSASVRAMQEGKNARDGVLAAITCGIYTPSTTYYYEPAK